MCFFLPNIRPLLNEPEVNFALVIAVFINYLLKPENCVTDEWCD